MAKKAMTKKDSGKKRTVKISKSFVTILAIVSILGFASIILQSWFQLEFTSYAEAFILLVIGIGIILESEPKILFENIKSDLDKNNFSRLTTFVLGALAVISGFLSFPFVGVEHFIFSAVKGIISFIAIIFIIIQTWVVRDGSNN